MTDKKYPHLICGWLAPNGDFTECKYEEHRYLNLRLLSRENDCV